MRLFERIGVPFLVFLLMTGCSTHPAKLGLSYSGATHADEVRLLVDETWTDASGQRQVKQEIFDSVYEIVDQAEQFILIDFFLLNDLGDSAGADLRPLSDELTDRLIAKRIANPAIEILFITDPLNTIYGSITSRHFEAMEKAGVRVIWTNLDALRDSNPVYSKPWRLLAKPWGTAPGNAVSNPLGEGRISVRSTLKLLNFKANHRKLIASEKSLLVTSANPHRASSRHWNTALRVDGAGMDLACMAESAILRLSGAEAFQPESLRESSAPNLPSNLYLLTESRIKDRVLSLLDGAPSGARIDLCMFYLSHREVLAALVRAKQRGCDLRILLDPNKDAFGRIKNGIPNRQSADRLVRAGIPVRWADTQGEQCHVKMLYVQHDVGAATIVLGSCNYTRRNLDDLNAECNLAYTASENDAALLRARETFDRWWGNPDGQTYSVEYATYADSGLYRKFIAWFKETTGICTF